jgi:hypothetical protein
LDHEQSREGWNLPRPAHLPRPTWWPAALALGVTLTFWGLIASVFILAVGILVTAVSLAGWIREIRLEHARAGRGVPAEAAR